MTSITWAIFENTGSTNVSLARGLIACMFLVSLGYSGPANTFMATVSQCCHISLKLLNILLQYPAEIMPTSMRPTGVAVAYMTQHVLIIILIQFTPIALETISWRFFLIFVCGSAIFSVVFYFFYPETRYKSLEEIEAIFGDKVRRRRERHSLFLILTLCRSQLTSKNRERISRMFLRVLKR